MKIFVEPDAGALSEAVARRAAEFIGDNPGALVCLAAGDTPLEAYNRMIRLQNEGVVDLSSVYYVGWTSGWGWDARPAAPALR